MDEPAFIRSEIPDVQRIVQDECWLEGERRGKAVDRNDPVIRERVANIILGGAGRMMRLARMGCGAETKHAQGSNGSEHPIASSQI